MPRHAMFLCCCCCVFVFFAQAAANSDSFHAAYWIAFGPHGPRTADPPGTGARVAWGVVIGLASSLALFSGIRMAAKPAPHTMNKEWQEATNEYLKVNICLQTLRSWDIGTSLTRWHSLKPPIPLLVSPLPDIPARVLFSLLPNHSKRKTRYCRSLLRTIGAGIGGLCQLIFVHV